MTLRGNYGGEIKVINCEAIDADVVNFGDDGTPAMTRTGLAIEVQPGFIDGAPEHCPLTIAKDARELGNFAICNTCPKSIIIDDSGMTEC